MNQVDPLSNLGSSDEIGSEIPPAPDEYDFEYPLVSKRSKDNLKEFGLNMVDDYRDFKYDLLSWLATYGKNPEKHEGLARTTLESTHHKLETVFRWLWRTKTNTRLASLRTTRINSFEYSISRTAKALKRWLNERSSLEKYDGRMSYG